MTWVTVTTTDAVLVLQASDCQVIQIKSQMSLKHFQILETFDSEAPTASHQLNVRSVSVCENKNIQIVFLQPKQAAGNTCVGPLSGPQGEHWLRAVFAWQHIKGGEVAPHVTTQE